MGYVRCLKHVLPIMQKQGRGRVVNLIGNDGVKPSYWEIAPGAANAAGQNLTLALAAQYGRDNISFVVVNPGPVLPSAGLASLTRWLETWKSRARRLICSLRVAFHWGASPNARRSPVSWLTLASDLAYFINGTMIEIDGGQHKPLMDRLRDR
jgi:NAD(P)-dependent dehydrogenase (short-subunit alcohol dehydrogenase family)